MTPPKPLPDPSTLTNAQLTHCWRNSRALLRRRGLSDRLRETLPLDIAAFEAEARSRNPPVILSRRSWRSYPDRSGNLSFRSDQEDGQVSTSAPAKARRPDPIPAGTNPADLLAALEASLALYTNTKSNA